MFKKLAVTAAVLFNAGLLFASEKAAETAVQVVSAGAVGYFNANVTAVMIGLAICAGLCGIGQGLAVSSALSGISRQPEATSKIQLNMIIGLAFIESLVLYTLFIGIVLLFVNPFTKYIVQ